MAQVPRAAAAGTDGGRRGRGVHVSSSSVELSDAKLKPEAVRALVSLRLTRGRGPPPGDKVFFLLRSEAAFSTLSAPRTDSQR